MPQIRSDVVEVYVFRRVVGGVEILVLQRSARSRFAGAWQTVRGRVEAGEAAWRTALRELEEETGCAPVQFWQLERVSTFYRYRDDAVQLCPCFAAELAPDAVVSLCDEHAAYRWEPPDRAADLMMWPSERSALEELLTEIVEPRSAEPYLRIPLQ